MTSESSLPTHDGTVIMDGGLTILSGNIAAPKFVSHHWWGLESVPQLGCAFIRLVKEVVYSPQQLACPDYIDVAAVLHLHDDSPRNTDLQHYTDGGLLLYLEERLHALRCVDRFFRKHPDFEEWFRPVPGIRRSNEELIRSTDLADAGEQVVMVIHQPQINAWEISIPALSMETQASLARAVRTAMIVVLDEVVPASLTVELMTQVPLY